MNIISLDKGEGRDSYVIFQSISRNIPIICPNKECRKSLIHSGKILCSKLDQSGKLNMPDPITYDEFDHGLFNKSLEYIFYSIEDYFKYKEAKVRTIYNA